MKVYCWDKIFGFLALWPDTTDNLLGNVVHLKSGLVCDLIGLYVEIIRGESVRCKSSNDRRRRFYKYSSATLCRVPLYRKKKAGASIFTRPNPTLWRSEMSMRWRGGGKGVVLWSKQRCHIAKHRDSVRRLESDGRVGGGEEWVPSVAF